MMEPSRHDKAMSNVRVGPPYSQLKDIYLFIYLSNKDWGIYFNKIYNYKDTRGPTLTLLMALSWREGSIIYMLV
jgi:hypothetical protein